MAVSKLSKSRMSKTKTMKSKSKIMSKLAKKAKKSKKSKTSKTKRVMKRIKKTKGTKKMGGGYNLPHRYFGAKPNSNFTQDGDLTTANPLPENFFWNSFSPRPLV